MESPAAAVLLSGGLDSATVLAIARADGFECHCLTVDYGQRHHVELAAARSVARALGAASHRELTVDLRAIGGSALTEGIEVPKDRRRTLGADHLLARAKQRPALLLELAEVPGRISHRRQRSRLLRLPTAGQVPRGLRASQLHHRRRAERGALPSTRRCST
jgi:7-cyano-7-deazaguanine synthase